MVEKGELITHNEEVPSKLQQTPKGKGKASSVESKEDQLVTEVHLQTPVWDPQLELGSYTSKLHHQEVPKRERPLPCGSPGATPPIAEGHSCVEDCEIVRPLSIPKEELGLGKFLDTP